MDSPKTAENSSAAETSQPTLTPVMDNNESYIQIDKESANTAVYGDIHASYHQTSIIEKSLRMLLGEEGYAQHLKLRNLMIKARDLDIKLKEAEENSELFSSKQS